MPQTMDLYAKALEKMHAAAWAREFNITPGALSHAVKQGRLSPLLAGNFAIELGEDPDKWMAIAAVEAEQKESPLLSRLKQRSKHWRRL
ncbi:MAG: hypothetical protein J7556_13540 [Acidovorax sp.]|nr:hypothetical protein [Acidovorax sp.]